MKTKWQKGAYFLTIFAIISSLLVGCALFRDPTGSWNKATNKVEAVQSAINKNEDATTAAARTYVFATQEALNADPSTNRAHEVASDMNEKALVTLGPPSMQEVVYLKEMVKNLLATNTATILRGEEQLADLDAQVIKLQKENQKLQTNLEKAEAKVISVGTVNAGYASKWTAIVKVFWWIVYGFIAVIIIKVLSAVLPPPYNSIVSIIAVPIGLIIKGIQGCVPEAKKAAGVVAAGTYDNTKLALQNVIEAIEEAKRDKPHIVQEIVPYLKDATNKEITRPLITDVKREMGYV